MSSDSRVLRRSAFFASLAFVISALLLPATLLAQDDSVPKYDVFVGYQWLHPGGNVPSPLGTPSNPTPFQFQTWIRVLVLL